MGRKHRPLGFDELQQQALPLRHTALQPHLGTTDETLRKSLARVLRRWVRNTREQRRWAAQAGLGGAYKVRQEAEDCFLSLVKNAKPDLLADAILAADQLRSDHPELFVSDRTFGQERLKLLLHLDKTARRYSSDGSINGLVRLNPAVVELLDGFVSGCLTQAKAETPGHRPQVPPKAPPPTVLQQLRDLAE